LPFAISVEEVSHVIASPSIVEAALQFPRREQMKIVLDMTEYSVHGAREALNVSLAQFCIIVYLVFAQIIKKKRKPTALRLPTKHDWAALQPRGLLPPFQRSSISNCCNGGNVVADHL
jgi:hypothetical protein